jgi:hypothetical protein
MAARTVGAAHFASGALSRPGAEPELVRSGFGSLSELREEILREEILSALKQPPPLPIGFAPSRGLDLAPIPALPRTIGGITPLAHDALEPALLGHAQQRQAVFEWFGQRRRLGSRNAPRRPAGAPGASLAAEDEDCGH